MLKSFLLSRKSGAVKLILFFVLLLLLITLLKVPSFASNEVSKYSTFVSEEEMAELRQLVEFEFDSAYKIFFLHGWDTYEESTMTIVEYIENIKKLYSSDHGYFDCIYLLVNGSDEYNYIEIYDGKYVPYTEFDHQIAIDCDFPQAAKSLPAIKAVNDHGILYEGVRYEVKETVWATDLIQPADGGFWLAHRGVVGFYTDAGWFYLDNTGITFNKDDVFHKQYGEDNTVNMMTQSAFNGFHGFVVAGYYKGFSHFGDYIWEKKVWDESVLEITYSYFEGYDNRVTVPFTKEIFDSLYQRLYVPYLQYAEGLFEYAPEDIADIPYSADSDTFVWLAVGLAGGVVLSAGAVLIFKSKMKKS